MKKDTVVTKLRNAGTKAGEFATSKAGIATAGGGCIGAYVGSSVGIAALGTAVSGLLPLAVVGAGAGLLGAKAWQYRKEAQAAARGGSDDQPDPSD